MSQVGFSRPATQLSGRVGVGVGVSLPEIQHPLSRMSNPGNMDVRGVSRAGDRPGSNPGLGRPLASENVYRLKKSTSAMSTGERRESRLSFRKEAMAPQDAIDTIPEGVEVTYGNPDKPRMPVFGSRASVADRAEVPPSRASTRLSRPGTQARLEIDELESLLKEKLKTNYYEVRKRFKDNDPEGKGNVSREAFCRILMLVLNRPVSQSQFNRLSERVGLKNKSVVSFTEFFSHFREVPGESDYPQWMDPVNRTDRVTMSAASVHMHLKEKAKQRFLDVADMFPQMNPGGSGRILKPEFKQLLNKMLFFMEDDEFDKLWNRYDSEGTGVVQGAKFLKSLGIEWRNTSSEGVRKSLSPVNEEGGDYGAPVSERRTPRRKEQERKQQLNIERWLKDKFREGFFQMKESFEELDTNSTGVVSFDNFLDVLRQFGLSLEKPLLGSFLARCSVQVVGSGVPYREFLHRFQDRSENGMTHNILTDKKHKYNHPGSVDGVSTVSAIEAQLMNMFQRDFLALLGTFKSIDKIGQDIISQEEFRAAIESRFSLELTDTQFEAFTDRVPMDEEGNVRYAEFMQLFDTKGKAQSLFQGKRKTVDTLTIPQPEQSQSPRQPLHEDDFEDNFVRRTPQEIFKVIKDLLHRRYQDVEAAFYDLDETNTRRLTTEMMHQLLKRFDIQPEVSRREIRDLWKTFITNTDRTLDYLQFVRHFGFSLRSATYPNAKLNPPRRGDADYMLRSRKLNCASDMLQDSLRSKVDYMWEDLRREFVNMDPYSTGFVTREEFRDVLTELCVHLSMMELDQLSERFDIRQDGRVSYVEFLKPFALRKQVWRHGNNMLSLLQHPQPELPIADVVEPPQQGLHGITAKLRQKLAGDWKNLRRAFRKLDVTGNGYLSVPEFRSVLKLANVLLDEDEVYHVMTQFDRDMTGKISYDKFIDETFRPETRRSARRPSQS
ncbi:EF-hand calcium-binding domain-containing protein 6-like isoform X1 [Haliotis rufescens]|uniref:EF-hand calcium-binding domain-containing protein 6-like isoform X1 n=1 Tax=Haliotis rufescens TaxID=6454 RepID=UPI00201F76F7|nr:EF-hand calcium-binding domain-containing protein 6-like isoform X1 [Haliotis rufescens]